MSHPSYILTAWILSSVVTAIYGVSLVLRGRRFTRAVPPDRARWMRSNVTSRRVDQ